MAAVDDTELEHDAELAARVDDGELEHDAGDVDEQDEDREPDDDADLDDDDDQDDDGEPADEGLTADERAVLQQASAEQTLKKVSQSGDRYIKRVIELLGPELGGYQVCANCDGYLPGLVLLELVDDERRNAVKRQLGIDTFDDLQADESHFRRCETCNGRGRVRTGSTKHGQESQDCIACSGFGFRRVGGQAAATGSAAEGGGPALVPAPPPASVEPAAIELPPYDEFGTPSWHEDYGKQPHYRSVPVSHWAGNLTSPA